METVNIHETYRAIPVGEQVEVLSMIGDIPAFEGKPIVHMHACWGGRMGAQWAGMSWSRRLSRRTVYHAM